MANKKKRTKSNELRNAEATVKAIQSLLTTPETSYYVSSGALRGVREKILSINFQSIRNLVERVPIINAVINARIDQVLPFTVYTSDNKGDRGFTLVKTKRGEDVGEKDEGTIDELVGFLAQTGFDYDPEREDDFSDYISILVREILTIDQIATEVQRNRKNDAIAFWALDGSLIKRVDRNSKEYKKDIRFVQEFEGKVYNTYTDESLLFDYKNKRADLKFRGWGYSPVEQCIDLITTLLFGYNHTRDQFLKDRMPRGFLAIMGEAGAEQLEAIRRYWYAAMSGAGGRWNIPILPSGKEGTGIDFKQIGQSNRDMEYHKTMMFVSSIVASVFSIDLIELGIKSDDSSALIGESSGTRLDASRDKGLSALLSFLSQHINKIIRKVTTDWTFKFVGLQKEDEQTKATLYKTRIESYMTVNEVRKEEGLEALEDKYADVVLNMQAVQLYQAEQGAQGGPEGGAPGGEEGPPPEEGGTPGEEQGGEEGQEEGKEGETEGAGDKLAENTIDWEHMFKKGLNEKRQEFLKSLRSGKDIHVRIE